MSKAFDAAVAEVRMRREVLLNTAAQLRARAALPRLADETLRMIDPQLGFLKRLQQGIARNKLLSLAVLAGAGWLAGSSVRPDGKPPAARPARRAKPKENNNDSGQQQRNQRTGPGPGQRGTRSRPEDLAQARSFGEARTLSSVTPDGGKPRRQPGRTVGIEPEQWPLEPDRRRQPLTGEFVTGP